MPFIGGVSLGKPETVAVAVPGIIVALFGLYVLSFPFGLTGIHGTIRNNYGYDDGVYFSAAVRLLHGDIPYADFLFLHPPGITLLMSPAAGVATVFGTPAGLAVARIITVAVAAMNASLAALMLRHRGPRAMLTAGLVLALYPAAINATHTLLLEPYVVFFCLIGVNLAFNRAGVASTRRVALAGVALGFACTVKLWAVPIVIATALVLAVYSRRALAILTAGTASAFGAVCLPFLLVDPRGFIADVFIAQVQRREGGRAPALHKLRTFTGADSINTVHIPDSLVIAGAAVFAGVLLWWTVRYRRSLAERDWCVIGGAVLATAAVFSTGQFYAHYGYLPFAWLAMTAGLLVPPTAGRHLPRAASVAAAAACAVMLVVDADHARVYLHGSFNPADTIRAAVPRGACLVVTFATFPVVADRLIADDPGCPKMVDPFGEWVEHTPAHRPYRGALPVAFVKSFAAKLNDAGYVAFGQPNSSYVPWTPELRRWYAANFVEVRHTVGIALYEHRGHSAPPSLFPSLLTNSASELIAAGIEVEKSGDIATAFDYYQAAIARDGDDKFAHFDAGHIWQTWGNAVKAEAEYDAALRLDPDFPSALYNLAVLKSAGDPQAAVDLYRRVIAVQPDNASALFNLGVLLYQAGDPSGTQLVRDAIALQPRLAGSVPGDVTLDDAVPAP